MGDKPTYLLQYHAHPCLSGAFKAAQSAYWLSNLLDKSFAVYLREDTMVDNVL